MSNRGTPPKLSLFDVTNLVVGAIIGADIYVASSFGAAYLGPSSLIVWGVAGVIAIVIALCFAQCAAYLPRVGGPYAYARDAWGPFPGFIVGWSLWLAEWISLAVFPVAFVRYLTFFLPNLDPLSQVLVKACFVAFLIVTNVLGVKAAGRTNDILTIVKLAPLILFVVAGTGYALLNTATVASNLSPFSPFGYGSFGLTLVLVFWAYAGFEISTIPADVVEDPGKVIPRAIVLGMTIVTVFYLATNVVLFAIRPSPQLATDLAPLASATVSILGTGSILAILGGLVVSVGALISVTGSDESGMIGTSRLGYALAVDGLFPKIFAKVHPRYKTPYFAIIVQGATALVASLLGNLGDACRGVGLLPRCRVRSDLCIDPLIPPTRSGARFPPQRGNRPAGGWGCFLHLPHHPVHATPDRHRFAASRSRRAHVSGFHPQEGTHHPKGGTACSGNSAGGDEKSEREVPSTCTTTPKEAAWEKA